MEKDIYEKAIEFYGKSSQIGVAQEECAELIQALSKYRRCMELSLSLGDNTSIKNLTKEYIDSISEEMADVEIMLRQLKIIFGNEKEVETWKARKLERLNGRINAKDM